MTGLNNGKVAIVTGAASGIGWAAAQRLARDVAHVVIADLHADAASACAARLGRSHWSFTCDVASEPAVQDLVKAVVERFGRVDVLVNNAGIGDQGVPTLDQNVQEFQRTLDVHLKGTFIASREVARVFIPQGSGAIVNVSSITGFRGHPTRNAYGAAKAGIASMTSAMASEWAPHGIRVNAVAPGYVLTELVEGLVKKGAVDLDAIKRRTPMRRLGTTQEIAEVMAFLASDQASFLTGATIPVDGGWLAYGAP